MFPSTVFHIMLIALNMSNNEIARNSQMFTSEGGKKRGSEDTFSRKWQLHKKDGKRWRCSTKKSWYAKPSPLTMPVECRSWTSSGSQLTFRSVSSFLTKTILILIPQVFNDFLT